jgi:hypothetical protein
MGIAGRLSRARMAALSSPSRAFCVAVLFLALSWLPVCVAVGWLCAGRARPTPHAACLLLQLPI